MKWQRIWRTNEWNISNWGRGSLLGAELGKLSVKCGADLGYLAFQMHFPLFVAQLQNNPGWESPGRFGPFEFWSLPMGPAPASNPLETLGGIFKGIRGCWTLVSLRLFTSPQISVSPEFSPDVTGRGKHAWGYIGWMGTGEMLVCSSKAFLGDFQPSFPHLCCDFLVCPRMTTFPNSWTWRKVSNPYWDNSRPAPLGFTWYSYWYFSYQSPQDNPTCSFLHGKSFQDLSHHFCPIPAHFPFLSPHPKRVRADPQQSCRKKTKKKLTGKISVMFCHSGKHEQALCALKQQ